MLKSGSRRKGSNAERELVEILRAAGIPARRVPLSGGAGGVYSGDVIVGAPKCLRCRGAGGIAEEHYLAIAHAPTCVGEERFEVKRRGQGRGFIQIDRWLEDAHAVVYRRDRGEWIVTLRLQDYIKR